MHRIIKTLFYSVWDIVLTMPVTALNASSPEDIFIIRNSSLIIPNRSKPAIARFGEYAGCGTSL
jgi:hypothetical protein